MCSILFTYNIILNIRHLFDMFCYKYKIIHNSSSLVCPTICHRCLNEMETQTSLDIFLVCYANLVLVWFLCIRFSPTSFSPLKEKKKEDSKWNNINSTMFNFNLFWINFKWKCFDIEFLKQWFYWIPDERLCFMRMIGERTNVQTIVKGK